MIGCVYLIKKNVTDYLSYPVVTNIETIYENKPSFPSVEICKSQGKPSY